MRFAVTTSAMSSELAGGWPAKRLAPRLPEQDSLAYMASEPVAVSRQAFEWGRFDGLNSLD